MAASVVDRATWTDDDGTGTTGTIINNTRLQADIYDKIDELFDGTSPFNLGGAVGLEGIAAPSVSASGKGKIYFDSTANKFKRSEHGGAYRSLGDIELLYAASGTDSNASAANVSTIALASGLTALDALLVYYVLEAGGSGGVTVPRLYNATDSVDMGGLGNGSETDLSAGAIAVCQFLIQLKQGSTVSVHTTMKGNANGGSTMDKYTAATFSTNWTGNWTLALRHGGIAGGSSLKYRWSVYKALGQ